MLTPPMRLCAVSLVLGAATLGCAHEPCESRTPLGGCPSRSTPAQDRSVRCPDFYETEPTQIAADGGIFELDDLVIQALQVATGDFFEGPRPLGRPCSGERWAYSYRVVRRGDIVFVKITGKPQQCGLKVISHAGATYAIDPDGKILHRHWGDTLLDDYEGHPDGGRRVSPSDLGVIELEAPANLPMEFFGGDAGTSPDAGTGADAGMDTDGGSGPDAGTLE